MGQFSRYSSIGRLFSKMKCSHALHGQFASILSVCRDMSDGKESRSGSIVGVKPLSVYIRVKWPQFSVTLNLGQVK